MVTNTLNCYLRIINMEIVESELKTKTSRVNKSNQLNFRFHNLDNDYSNYLIS